MILLNESAVGRGLDAVELGIRPAPGQELVMRADLDDLARDRAYEFFFVLGPLLLKGGIGVPINPIAML